MTEQQYGRLRQESSILWQESLQPYDRVIITGASGWFGQTALALCKDAGIETYAITRNKILKPSSEVIVSDWNANRIIEFSPTVVIDCAFQTREKLSVIQLEDYVEQNTLLTNRMLWLSALDSVRVAMTVSSGAAIYPVDALSTTIEENPYGFLKRSAELKLTELGKSRGISIVIPRAWSVSGAYCPKPTVFAFTDLICQALQGRIQVNSNFSVYRRYTSVEDLLAVSLASASEKTQKIIDSGGELIEIFTLAKRIRDLISPEAEIIRGNVKDEFSDNYFSSEASWNKSCKLLNFEPENLDSQIVKVANYLQWRI